MKWHAGILVIGLALLLGGCDDVTLFGDDDSASNAPQANGCTAAGCPQAQQFCTARGYSPGTEAYNRCLVSVNENLRKGR